ncbi:cell division protein FtsW [Rothia aeria]|uniref:Cell division protein FtsW n=1 Tax=Rothia aeria TaxID=172042 RepID=A0A2Z5QZ22_9MICC|nr:cell division protein FtsW [Rothia aeria]
MWRDGVLARRYASAYARISRAELSYVSRLILLVSVSLTFFGCIMVLSASSVRMISQGMSPFNQGNDSCSTPSGVLPSCWWWGSCRWGGIGVGGC